MDSLKNNGPAPPLPVHRWRMFFRRTMGVLMGLLLVFVTAGAFSPSRAVASNGVASASLHLSLQMAQNSTLGTLPGALKSPRVSLRHHVVVRDTVVRLKDLFDGPLSTPQKPVLRAPPPGQSVDLDLGFLNEMARTLSLAWRPLSQSEKVTITRAGREILRQTLLEALTAALVRQGMQETADIEILPPPPPLFVAEGSRPILSTQGVHFDATSGRFLLGLTITADDTPPRSLSLSGVTYRTIDLPVAATTNPRGHILEPHDITHKRVRLRAISRDVATDDDQVLGMISRRVLRPGDTFRLRDLKRPNLVHKGDMVTMILDAPMMHLTTQGKALQDGALADIIKVQNPRSGKTISATVVKNRTVEVRASP